MCVGAEWEHFRLSVLIKTFVHLDGGPLHVPFPLKKIRDVSPEYVVSLIYSSPFCISPDIDTSHVPPPLHTRLNTIFSIKIFEITMLFSTSPLWDAVSASRLRHKLFADKAGKCHLIARLERLLSPYFGKTNQF